MRNESELVRQLRNYLAHRGRKVYERVKVRGRVVDFAIVGKDNLVTLIEVKGESGDVRKGIEQALHQKMVADYSYLAIPSSRSSTDVILACQNLGIGLLLINGRVRAALKPEKGKALDSVRSQLLRKPSKLRARVFAISRLERLFKSKGQVLILKMFFMNPMLEAHQREIARITGLSAPYVKRELENLETLGLVRRRSKGNLILFTINRESPIFEELKRIFIKYELLDQIIAKKLQPNAIKFALIYGSFAKGSEIETSDIDLLVVGDVDEDDILSAVSKTERTTGRTINYILWNTKEYEAKLSEGLPLLKEIGKNPVIMIVGDEGEFKRSVEKAYD